MSATPNDGGPAFPLHVPGNDRETFYQSGMSLRDWLAGQALPQVQRAWEEHCEKTDESMSGSISLIVEDAYEIADAMLAERAKERSQP